MASQKLTAWLDGRPRAASDAPLPQGGRLVRYVHNPAQPKAARNEAFYTGTPGLAAAILVVHSDAERRAAGPATARSVAATLEAPPIGLLTGVWQFPGGAAFRIHDNRLHVLIADPDGAAPARWRAIDASPIVPATAHERFSMLDQQGDGAVYARLGDRLMLRLGDQSVQVMAMGTLEQESVVRVSADGRVHVLHDGGLK